jgi:hypothetical protein
MTTFDRPKADFLNNPVYFVELAREWAEGGPAPSQDHASWLEGLSRPVFAKPALARQALWGVLSYPARGRALSWLNELGLLQELLPCWDGSPARRAFRLKAAEELHLERWASLLSATAFDWLCVYQDQRVEGRLSGWAITGLTTLLLTGDDDTDSFATRVEHDLKKLGAHSGEYGRIVAAIREYPALIHDLMQGKTGHGSFSPNGIIAALCTAWAMPGLSDDERTRATVLADKLLLRYAAPDAANSALFFHAP